MAVASGFRGRVEIDGKIFRANRWNVEYTVETDDATGTKGIPTDPFDSKESSGKHRLPTKTYYAKVVDITVTIEAFYDNFHGYFTASGKAENGVAPVNVYMVPGREVELKLYPAKDKKDIAENPSFGKNDSYWKFSKFLILSCSHSTEARGVAKISFTGKNNSKDYEFKDM
jgi:hypothetical protein